MYSSAPAASPLRDEEAVPTYNRTIDRSLVHKAGPEAVWVSDTFKLSEDIYVCHGQVPRSHLFINDLLPPLHTYDDLSFLSELGRQAGISTMHEYEGVPVDWATVFLKMSMTLTDPKPHELAARPVPTTVTVRYTNRELDDDGVLTTVGADLIFEVDGAVRATSSILASAHPKAPYKAWRAEMRSAKPLAEHPVEDVEPVDPALVGRRLSDNVLVGAATAVEGSTFTFPVRVDQLHPHFFEHPMDHVPGVVHLEAARQAGLLAAGQAADLDPAGAVVLRCSTRFAEFAELELPLYCTVTVGEPRPADGGLLDVPLNLTLSQPAEPVVTTMRFTLRGRPRLS